MSFRFDETDPQLLIVYTAGEYTAENYRELGRRWVARIERGERFGVLIVNEPYKPQESGKSDHSQQEYEAEEINRLVNAFRRDYRHLSRINTAGYANVYDPEAAWVISARAQAGKWESWQVVAESRARYMYGTHGGIFTDVQDAQQWLKSQLLQPPIDLEGLHSDLAAESTNHVGLYYGSTTGVTEKVAFDIQATWQQLAGETLVPINIGTVKDLSELLAYDYLILGVSTWNIGQLQDDWEIAFPQFDSIDLTGRKIALFGIGDQYGYPDNFLDALGILGNELIRRGATLVGYTDPSGYEFSTSLALENGQFMGLAIDEINQPELTESRISQWVTEVMDVFGLRYRAASTPDASTF